MRLEGLPADMRYALRGLRSDPRFTLLAVCALALGIGSATVIFSVIHAVLLHPFPYVDPNRLVSVFIGDAKNASKRGRNYFLVPEFLYYREQNRGFDQVIGISSEDAILTGRGDPERFAAGFVTANTFSVLGVAPLVGRTLVVDDDKPGAPAVAVLSYPVFRRKFGGDRQVLGKAITLNGRPTIVVGVMPPGFGWWLRDLWLPAEFESGERTNRLRAFYLWGRLKPGWTHARVKSDFESLAGHMASVLPGDYPKQPAISIQTLTEFAVGELRPTLYALLAAVGMLLLIACGNVANLLLARATAREKEIALRAALGASCGRLVRQLLVESFLLALLGAAGGCALAVFGIEALIPLIPPETIPTEAIIGLNSTVLLAALAITTLASLLFGLAPALHSARLELNQGLKGTRASSRGSLRNLLVVSEVALSLTLLVGAGLMIRTFFALRQVTLGFEPDRVLSARIPLPDQRYAKAGQKARFFAELLRRIEALPGVLSAAETCSLPPYGAIPTAFEIAGQPREGARGLFDLVSERYFETLGIRLLQGRTFTANEVADARKVMVVSQSMARENFGAENPIGREVKLAFLERTTDPIKDPWFRIVGVVTDIKNQGLQQPSKPQVYVPYTISGFASRGIFVRTAGDPRALLPAVRREIAAIDSSLALDSSGIGQPGSMRDLLTSFSFSQPRFTLILLSLFATAGLMLAGIGIYSVISYAVTRRAREMGIRMALGARSGHVMRIVLAMGMRLLVCGTVSGLLFSFALTNLLKTQIWGVPDHDPPTLIAVPLLTIAVGLAACYFPARRAGRVDPAIALRHD